MVHLEDFAGRLSLGQSLQKHPVYRLYRERQVRGEYAAVALTRRDACGLLIRHLRLSYTLSFPGDQTPIEGRTYGAFQSGPTRLSTSLKLRKNSSPGESFFTNGLKSLPSQRSPL